MAVKKFKLQRLASAAARACFLVAVVYAGQSNLAGDAMKWCGPRTPSQAERATSLSTGETDPMPGTKNTGHGGGSAPYLVDDLWGLGIKARVYDMAIGGAGIADYLGRAGAAVQGDATKPASLGYIDNSQFLADGSTPNPNHAKLVGGTLPVSEGHVDFDKFGLMARLGVLLQSLVGKYDAIVLCWLNGESDAGVSQEYYSTGLVSFSAYGLAHGASLVFLGLSSKPSTATTQQYQILEAGRAAAVATLQAQGKPVFDGANMFLEWGDQAPLYPETRDGPRVHQVLRGQRKQSFRWRDAIAAAIEI